MERIRSTDGTELAFERSGDGPPLVLVVGAFNDRSSMSSLATGLEVAFTVFRYDRRGRGDSGNTLPYAVEREVEDLAAVIAATGEPAFVFGHSSGAALAIETAASGAPIRSLALYEPPYTRGPSTAFAEHLENLVSEGRASEVAAAFLELVGTPPAVVAQMQGAPYWAHMEAFAPTLSYDIRLSNGGAPPLERLARVPAPVLALAGADSPAWAQEGARAIAAAVPGGQARVLQGQSHNVADDALIPVLKEFFKAGDP